MDKLSDPAAEILASSLSLSQLQSSESHDIAPITHIVLMLNNNLARMGQVQHVLRKPDSDVYVSQSPIPRFPLPHCPLHIGLGAQDHLFLEILALHHSALLSFLYTDLCSHTAVNEIDTVVYVQPSLPLFSQLFLAESGLVALDHLPRNRSARMDTRQRCGSLHQTFGVTASISLHSTDLTSVCCFQTKNGLLLTLTHN
jgi:hypothetical protein